MYGKRVSFDEFLALSEERGMTETVVETSDVLSSSLSCESDDEYDCDSFDYPCDYSVPSPSDDSLEQFKLSADYILSTNLARGSNVRDSYDLNWLCLEDYTEHWDLLSHDKKLLFRKLVLSDTATNSNRFGLKTKNLESHLLLSIGCDMNNIVNNGRCSILSNLKSPSSSSLYLYSKECIDTKAVDAKTCLRSYRKWKNEYDPSILFKNGFVAYQAVITSDSDYSSMKDPYKGKEKAHSFFKSNSTMFAGWLKRKKIYSYLYSHEVSVDSIIQAKYRPHTHLVFFLPKENRDSDLQAAFVKELEEEFNQLFSDRSMSILRKEVDSVMVPQKTSKIEEIERMFNYMHNCYSLANTYAREARSNNLRDLNKATVECYHNLIFLFKSEEGLDYRPVRRFNSSHIPKAGSEKGYKHPLLQKKKKESRIRVQKPKKSKDDSIATQNHQRIAASSRPSRQTEHGKLQKDQSRAGIHRKLSGGSTQRAVSGKKGDAYGEDQRRKVPLASKRGTSQDERRDGLELSILRTRDLSNHRKRGKLRKGRHARGESCMEWHQRRAKQRRLQQRVHGGNAQAG